MTQRNRPITVGLVGFGTVGQSVARILCEGNHPALRLTHVCNRRVARKRVDWVPADVVWTEDIDVVLSSDVDVVVELIGGLEPATDWIRRALQAGKCVVTANKQVIAHHGPELVATAAQQDRRLCFEAAVAGGIPVINGLREGLSGDSLRRILGILNGTCNYILTRMEADGVSFETALSDAQSLGFAEAVPTDDVDGFDAQAKLSILSAVGLNRQVETAEIPVGTITAVEAIDFAYAQRLGCTIRQVSCVELVADRADAVLASVQPTLVPRSSALASVEGSRNVVVVEGRFGGEAAFSGFGAGGDPTGVAVVSDLESIARVGRGAVDTLAGDRTSVLTTFVSPHYVRFVVADRPGIVARLAEVFSRHRINIDSVFQEPGWSKDELPFVMTLEACESTVVGTALRESAAFDFNVRPPLWMPVLKTGESRQ